MITPPTPTSGIIRLIHVLFDSQYKNVVDFKSKADKEQYFLHHKARADCEDWKNIELEFEDCQYSRKDGTLKVPIHIDLLNHVNYLMYKNPFYTDRWYYCFVIGKRYINDNCTELLIKTDVYQTWIDRAYFHPSFVEREHTMNDRIGLNVLPEGLETGEFVPYLNFDINKDLMQPIPCIAFTGDNIGSVNIDQGHTMINGIMTCIPYVIATSMLLGGAIIDNINRDGNGDKIFTAFTVPKLAVLDNLATLPNNWGRLKGMTQPPIEVLRIFIPEVLHNFYKPRNNKLFTYPYCYLGFNAPNGSSKIYRFENFYQQPVIFKAICEVNPNPTMVIYPTFYNGREESIVDGVTINGYPTLSYRNDYYNTWLAQNSSAINVAIDRSYFNYDVAMKYNENAQNRENTNAMFNAISSTVGTVANALTLNLGGAVNSGIGGFQNLANSGYNLQDLKIGEYATAGNLQYELRAIQANSERQQMLPDTGTLSSSNATLLGYELLNKSCFNIYSIKRQQAERIDQYFDMFGYQTNMVKRPNLKGRKRWNYVKTLGINITGFIPEEDRKELCNIFDSGVTIWHYPTKIYNYTLDNGIEVS